MVTAVNKGKGRGPQKESVRFRITFIREERRESMKILIRGPKSGMLQNGWRNTEEIGKSESGKE